MRFLLTWLLAVYEMGCAIWTEDFFAYSDFCEAEFAFGELSFASVTITG